MIDNRNKLNEHPGEDGINNFFFPPPPPPPHRPPHPHHPPYYDYGPYYPRCGGRGCYPKRHPWHRRYYNPYRRPW